MALIYDGNTIETSGHVDYSSHDLDRVVWNDPVVGSNIVWEREHTEWSGLKFNSVDGLSYMGWEWSEDRGGLDIQYSVDFGRTWVTISPNTYNIPFYEIWIKADNPNGYGLDDEWHNFVFYGSNVMASGNIMSMIDSVNFETLTTLSSSWMFTGLFYNCSNLVTPPTLPATILATGCYEYMFGNCTALRFASELPSQVLAPECYYGMFHGCTSLTTAPDLISTNLSWDCYSAMFWGCTSLTSAPTLPATTLASGCYQYMFQGCTSLTTAPSLPATTLADSCYYDMFGGCTNLNSVTCYARDISETDCTHNWLRNVSSTGDFYGYCSTPWTRTDSGIPEGWNWHCLSEEITVTASAINGTVTGGGVYNYGDTVTLTVTPNEGCSFRSWSDGSTSNPYVFIATNNVTLIATCSEIQYEYYIDFTDPLTDETWTVEYAPYGVAISTDTEGHTGSLQTFYTGGRGGVTGIAIQYASEFDHSTYKNTFRFVGTTNPYNAEQRGISNSHMQVIESSLRVGLGNSDTSPDLIVGNYVAGAGWPFYWMDFHPTLSTTYYLYHDLSLRKNYYVLHAVFPIRRREVESNE